MKHLLIASIVLTAFYAGCLNRVSVEDMDGNGTHVDVSDGFRYSSPVHIRQTESNIVVTVTFVRQKKENEK